MFSSREKYGSVRNATTVYMNFTVYCLPGIIGQIKLRMLRWVGVVACAGEEK
jgi:hypothetical protein